MVEKRPEEEVEEEYSTPAYPEITDNEIEQKNRDAITDLNTGEIIAVGDDEEDSENSDEYAEDVTNPAVEAEEIQTSTMTTEEYLDTATTEEYLEEKEEEEDATGSKKAENFVKLVRADGEKVEEMDGTKENPWIPFDDNKDIMDYQYEIEAERENQADMVSLYRISSIF